jgi:hypothetical protein
MTRGVAAWAVVLAFGCAAVGCASSDEAAGAEVSSLEDAIVRGSVPERAEVKVVLADAAFDPETLGAKSGQREVTFYDTASLRLWKDGVLLRSRRAPGAADDVTVKLRPMTPAKVPRAFRELDGFKCELDVTAGGDGTSSCSLTRSADGGDIRDARDAPREIPALWSRDALDFARTVVSDVPLDELRAFGPIASTVWSLDVPELGEEVTFERWDVKGGARTLEASVKVKTQNVTDKERELVAWLTSQGLARATTQTTKTSAALEALAGTP